MNNFSYEENVGFILSQHPLLADKTNYSSSVVEPADCQILSLLPGPKPWFCNKPHIINDWKVYYLLKSPFVPNDN